MDTWLLWADSKSPNPKMPVNETNRGIVFHPDVFEIEPLLKTLGYADVLDLNAEKSNKTADYSFIKSELLTKIENAFSQTE